MSRPERMNCARRPCRRRALLFGRPQSRIGLSTKHDDGEMKPPPWRRGDRGPGRGVSTCPCHSERRRNADSDASFRRGGHFACDAFARLQTVFFNCEHAGTFCARRTLRRVEYCIGRTDHVPDDTAHYCLAGIAAGRLFRTPALRPARARHRADHHSDPVARRRRAGFGSFLDRTPRGSPTIQNGRIRSPAWCRDSVRCRSGPSPRPACRTRPICGRAQWRPSARFRNPDPARTGDTCRAHIRGS